MCGQWQRRARWAISCRVRKPGSVPATPFAHASLPTRRLPEALCFQLIQDATHGGRPVKDRVSQHGQGVAGHGGHVAGRHSIAMGRDHLDQAIELVDLIHGDAEDKTTGLRN